MSKIERIKELVEILNRASDAYYNSGKTIMSDTQNPYGENIQL